MTKTAADSTKNNSTSNNITIHNIHKIINLEDKAHRYKITRYTQTEEVISFQVTDEVLPFHPWYIHLQKKPGSGWIGGDTQLCYKLHLENPATSIKYQILIPHSDLRNPQTFADVVFAYIKLYTDQENRMAGRTAISGSIGTSPWTVINQLHIKQTITKT